MDRRTLIAVVLSFGLFLGWQKLYVEPRMPKPGTQPTQTAQTSPATNAASSSTGATLQPATQAPSKPTQTATLDVKTGVSTIGDAQKFFVGWNLKDYFQGIATDTGAIDLHTVTQQNGQVEFAVDDPNLAYLSAVQGTLETTPQGIVWKYEDANVRLERRFTGTPTQPYIGLTVSADFKTKRPNYIFLSVSGEKKAEKDPEEQDRQLLYWTNNSLERIHLSKAIEIKEVATAVKYIGSQNRYFLMSLVNDSPIEPKGLVMPLPNGAGRISMVYPVTANSISIPVKAYFGPKELNTLRSVDPALDHTVDLGWFTVFAYPILAFLKWLYQFIGNYGVSIIILTTILKILTFPLTYKSMKSMKEMAKLQPQLQKLREKYADNKEELNRQMLTIMRSHGYNPMAGCLPILVQMPIFFALYRVLYSSIELYHAPFALWIKDLSVHDPYYITPVLLTVTMFLQQKLTPNTATDPTQQRMMQFMPVIFGAFMISLPSGLTLYMLVNAIASIIQQLILNKRLGITRAETSPA